MPNQRNSVRRSVRRRRRHRRESRSGVLGKLLVTLAIVAAIVLGIAIFFRVHTVEIQGNDIYSQEQIVQVSGVEPGDNLLMVNRGAVTGNIKARLPYIQDVSVGLVLPDVVVIKVVESEIAGLVKAENGGSWYINTLGSVLGSSVDDFTGQVIEITGVTVTEPQVGQDARASEEQAENLEAALQVIGAMEGTGLIDQVTSIDVTESFDIHIWCGEQYEVLLGGTEELAYKIQYFQAVLEQLEPFQTGTIDLTFDEERRARFRPWES